MSIACSPRVRRRKVELESSAAILRSLAAEVGQYEAANGDIESLEIWIEGRIARMQSRMAHYRRAKKQEARLEKGLVIK